MKVLLFLIKFIFAMSSPNCWLHFCANLNFSYIVIGCFVSFISSIKLSFKSDWTNDLFSFSNCWVDKKNNLKTVLVIIGCVNWVETCSVVFKISNFVTYWLGWKPYEINLKQKQQNKSPSFVISELKACFRLFCLDPGPLLCNTKTKNKPILKKSKVLIFNFL